jgi:Calcineurin-like phosphoesterase
LSPTAAERSPASLGDSNTQPANGSRAASGLDSAPGVRVLEFECKCIDGSHFPGSEDGIWDKDIDVATGAYLRLASNWETPLRENEMRKTILTLTVALSLAGVPGAFAQSPKAHAQRIAMTLQASKVNSRATAKRVSAAVDPGATVPNLKVAFIGDVGNGGNQRAVLNLIKSEGAQVVLHQGDFDYHSDPVGFWSSVDSILGANFPYFVSVGNHDVDKWPTTAKPSYSRMLFDRMARIGVEPDDLELNQEMYSLVFKGLKVVFVGEQKGAGDAVYAPYIRNQLKSDDHIWRICSWHRNMNAMQMGAKTDDMGWGVYEACREFGAIIATGHEHSYERTKTLISMSNQTVDPDSPDPDQLVVAPGKTFAFVSGLGGESIRVQKRCFPATPPYGCKGEWAKIYTSDQHAQYGALFITFYVNGDPNKAHGYFKNINGQIVDEFDITNGSRAAKSKTAVSGKS